MYPSPGRPLVPELLVPYIGDHRLSADLAEAAGLSAGVTLGDLVPSVWESLPRDVVDELVDDVVHAAARALQRMNGDLVVYRERPRVDEARLSVRTWNVLRREQVVENDRLRPVAIGTMRRFVNFGVRSMLDLFSEVPPTLPLMPVAAQDGPGERDDPAVSPEVVAAARALADEPWAQLITAHDPRFGPMIRSLDPTATNAWEAAHLCAGRRYPADHAAEVAEEIVALREACAAASRMTLQAELRQILESFELRDNAVKMLRRRFGFTGRPPKTLEVAADKVGVTRERVRQVEAKFKSQISGHPSAWTPVLGRALALAAERAPVAADQMAEMLVGDGLASKPFSVESLVSAATVFGKDVPFDVSDGLVLPSGAADIRRPVLAAAQKLASKWGAVSVRSLRDTLPVDEKVKLKALRNTLDQVPDVAWLDEAREWFAMPVTRCRLRTNVLKIMSVARSVPLSLLCEGVVRNERMKGFAAPDEVVAAWCEWTGDFAYVDGSVVANDSVPDRREVLEGIESTLADVLSTYGPVMDRKALEHECVDVAGVNKTSFNIYLSFSPIIETVGPSRYALRGLADREPFDGGFVPLR